MKHIITLLAIATTLALGACTCTKPAAKDSCCATKGGKCEKGAKAHKM